MYHWTSDDDLVGTIVSINTGVDYEDAIVLAVDQDSDMIKFETADRDQPEILIGNSWE